LWAALHGLAAMCATCDSRLPHHLRDPVQTAELTVEELLRASA
jgi:hypothetical protein